MAMFWLKQWDSGTPDARYADGNVWSGQWDSGAPDARYAAGEIWLGQWDSGTPDGRYADGQVWVGQWDSGTPDARYADGEVWLGQWDSGTPDARYDGSDGGAAAATLLLLLHGQSAAASGSNADEGDGSEPTDDDNADSTDSFSGSTSSRGSGEHASTSPSSPSSSGGGLGVVGTIILIVFGFAIWSDSRRKPTTSVEQPPNTAVSPRSNSSAAPDPWAAAISVPAAFREGADLKITAQNILVFDGVPMGLPFRYIDRETPRGSLLSEASATGRYRMLTMCGVDWCDDARIIDLRRRLMAPFSGSKNGAADGVLWSPDDQYALIRRSHAGASDFIALNIAALRVSQMTSLDSVFGNESGDLGGPGDLPRSSPHVRFDLSSAVWPAATRVEVEGDVYKTQWAENNGGWSGEPVRSGRIRLRISVPSMKFTVLDRTSVEPGNAVPEAPGARRISPGDRAEDAPPANHALEPTARN